MQANAGRSRTATLQLRDRYVVQDSVGASRDISLTRSVSASALLVRSGSLRDASGGSLTAVTKVVAQAPAPRRSVPRRLAKASA